MTWKLWTLTVLNVAVVALAAACSSDGSNSDEVKDLSLGRSGYWVEVDDLYRLASFMNDDGSCGPIITKDASEFGSYSIDAYRILNNNKVEMLANVTKDKRPEFSSPEVGSLMYPGVIQRNETGSGLFVSYGFLQPNGVFSYDPAYLSAFKSVGVSITDYQIEFQQKEPDKIRIYTYKSTYSFGGLGGEKQSIRDLQEELIRISPEKFEEMYAMAEKCSESYELLKPEN